MLSFAVSAALAGAALSIGPAPVQSAGGARWFVPSTENAPPIRIQLRASQPLTAQQLRDLELKPDQWNMKARLPPDITHALGLTSGTQTLTVRQLGRKTSAGYALALNLIPNSTDMIVLVREPSGAINAFLLGGDFSVKKTALLQQGKPATDIPARAAQELLDTALGYLGQLAAAFAGSK